MLYNLGPPGGNFPLGQRSESLYISQNQTGLIEGSDQVLSLGVINRHLAANRGIHHRHQARGNLKQGHPPEVGSRHKSGKVSHHSPTESQDDFTALGAALDQEVVHLACNLNGLAFLAPGHNEGIDAKARVSHRLRDFLSV